MPVRRRQLTQEESHGDAEEGDAGGLRAEQAAAADQAGPNDGGWPLTQPPADHGHQRGCKGKEAELLCPKMTADALQGLEIWTLEIWGKRTELKPRTSRFP